MSPTVLTVLKVAGTVFSAVSAFSKSRSEAAGLDRQADADAEEARVARGRAAAEQAQRDREARRRSGTRVSSIVSSGQQLSGSALDVLADAALEEELAIALTGFEGERQALQLDRRAAGSRASASATRRRGVLEAGGTLLTGGSSILRNRPTKTTLGGANPANPFDA